MQTILYTKSRLRVKSNFRKIKTKFLERAVKSQPLGKNISVLRTESNVFGDDLKVRLRKLAPHLSEEDFEEWIKQQTLT